MPGSTEVNDFLEDEEVIRAIDHGRLLEVMRRYGRAG